MEIKVCLLTYRMFFVTDTEDFFYRPRHRSPLSASLKTKRTQKFHLWLQKDQGESPAFISKN
jgi:hypothetical protein